MCGISGFYALQSNANSQLSKVEQSTQKLFLRGPDSGNTYCGTKVALGHRRLSIIDVSTNAGQPMTDHTGRYILIFNGEIFNYQQLSKQYLTDIWESFNGPRTTSDTEVLLNLLIEYGPECLSWLSGFFSFAFYDTEKNTLLVARDRFGKKPLLYYSCADYVAFASEMKALVEWGIPKELDYTVLHQYLQLNYIPQPQSILKGVKRLLPGHYMLIDENGINSISQYYELKINNRDYNKFTYDQAQHELVRLLDNSIQERMIADVPLGAFLSGGIDSSVIVALASRHTKYLNTFSIGYKDNPFFDETKYAKLVADKYGTNHTVFSLSNNDFLEHVHNVLDYLDEPFADSSAIPTYILCHHTRKHVTVALSGDGSDEMFSGYNKHAAEYKIRQASFINEIVKAGLPLWSVLPRSRNNKFTNIFRQLHRFAMGAKLSASDRYWQWASFNTLEQVNNLLSSQALAQVNNDVLSKEKEQILSKIKTDDFNEILLTDMNLVLTGDMLVKVDMMSMANSLEVRCPFLDYKVADFAFSIPENYKMNGGMKKKILQDAFRDMLPQELYNRPKHGFEIPLLGWLRNELWPLINDDLLSEKFVTEQGIFNAASIEELKRKLKSNNPEDSHATIWALIVFQHWWKKYLC
jgi:asparagine synthase (glutamine-hydrolysing)